MKVPNFSKILILVVPFILLPKDILCVSAEQDLTVTWKEKKLLDALKERVKDSFTKEYMKEEVYLINWVRAGDLNLDKAEALLRENLRWRKEYRMDEILDEDFKTMEQQYPIDLDGIDYEGRPVLAVFVGEWDIRALHVKGIAEENYRYCMQALEIASNKVREKQRRGEAVTRFQVLWNMNGFNLVQHGCLQCLPPYLRFVSAFQRYFPGMVDNIIFINAPPVLQTVLETVRPVAGQNLRSAMKIFGTEQRVWKKYLLSIIPPDQLDMSMGGTKIDTH